MYIIASFLLTCITAFAYSNERPLVLTRVPDCLATGIIGGISGAAATVAYAPFHYMQNQLAQKSKIEGNILRNCLRGCGILATVNIPTITVQAIVFKIASKALNCSDTKDPNYKKTLAAILAGGASAPITNISQLVVLHKQNTGASTHHIINGFPHSYRSLGRGIFPTTLQGIFFVSTYTNGLPYIHNEAHKHFQHKALAFILGTFLSASLLTATTQPLKVITARLHADIAKQKYNGAMDALIKIITTEGFAILFTGSQYRTVGNMFAISILTYVQQKLNALKNL